MTGSLQSARHTARLPGTHACSCSLQRLQARCSCSRLAGPQPVQSTADCHGSFSLSYLAMHRLGASHGVATALGGLLD